MNTLPEASAARRAATSAASGSSARVPDARAQGLDAAGFGGRHLRRDVHLGGDAARLRGRRYAQSVIAVGGRNHARRGLLPASGAQFVRSAAKFKGAGVLQMLQFQKCAAQRGGVFHGRFAD